MQRATEAAIGVIGRPSGKLAVALTLDLLLTSCSATSAQAPGTETPFLLSDKMTEQLKNNNPLGLYDTTTNRKLDPAMPEIEKVQGKFSSSVAIVGFDTNSADPKPIASEILSFENSSYVIFYDEEGKPATTENFPVNLKLGKDNNGNLAMIYKATVENQDGTKGELPFLTLFSNLPISGLDQDLISRAEQGDKDALDELGKLFNNADNLDEVSYENIATQQRIDIKRGNLTDWKTKMGDIFKMLNPFSVIPVQAAGLTPLPPPTEGAPATALNVAPEVKIVLDAQKAPYTVNESGEPVITVDGKEIVLNNLTDTKTDFGLSEDILNGVDPVTGDRYLYSEVGGIWAKVIEAGTPENRTKVNYEDFANGVVNASAALLYQENPTIPAGAIDPQWWLHAGANGVLRQVSLTLMPYDRTKLAPFDGKTKPFGETTLWLEFSVGEKNFVTNVQPNKNPDKDNSKPNQRINMNWTFDEDRFDQVDSNIDNLKDFVINNKVSLSALLEPDASKPSLTRSHPLLAGSDKVFSTPDLQTPGLQISLFSNDEQKKLEANFQVLDSGGDIPKDNSDILVSVLPQELALEPMTGNYVKYFWGDFQQ